MQFQKSSEQLTVDVGIAAYNAEKNIASLIDAVAHQTQEQYLLKRIIVHSDSSSDKTNDIVRNISDKRISLIHSSRQQGFALSIKKILDTSAADVSVLLNDDIKIRDSKLLAKICKPFIKDPETGLVAGRPLPYHNATFLNKAIISGFSAYDKARLLHRRGQNIHTMDGKIFAISKAFRKCLAFTKESGKMGNVDSYIYLSCLSSKFKYCYVKEAVVHYRNPATLQDYFKWYIRNNSNKYVQLEKFGKLAEKEFTLPFIPFTYYRVQELLKNPVGALFILITKLAIMYKAKEYSSKFEGTWSVVNTTKNFRNKSDKSSKLLKRYHA